MYPNRGKTRTTSQVLHGLKSRSLCGERLQGDAVATVPGRQNAGLVKTFAHQSCCFRPGRAFLTKTGGNEMVAATFLCRHKRLGGHFSNKLLCKHRDRRSEERSVGKECRSRWSP